MALPHAQIKSYQRVKVEMSLRGLGWEGVSSLWEWKRAEMDKRGKNGEEGGGRSEMQKDDLSLRAYMSCAQMYIVGCKLNF